jgi:hypothetical protein
VSQRIFEDVEVLNRIGSCFEDLGSLAFEFESKSDIEDI